MYLNGSTLYRHLQSGYERVQRGIALVGWVLLGLGLIALLVQVLSNFPNWLGPIFFGPATKIVMTGKMEAITASSKFSSVFVSQDPIFAILAPVPEALLLYIALAMLQPHPFFQPRRRMLSLLVLILALSAIGPPLVLAIIESHFSLQAYLPGPFQLCIIMYAIAAYARINFSRKESWLIEGIVFCAALLCTSLSSYISAGHVYQFDGSRDISYLSIPAIPASNALQFSQTTAPDFSQWSLQIPMLGIQVGGVSWLFQFVIWLLGLFCLHIFIGIGVHERTARRRSDELVKELTTAQEQLRAYALRAEELATMRERERVAREVHDTLAQGLTAIKMHLEAGAMVFRLQPELAQRHIERASELAGEHLSETRNSILNLRADALDGRTLPLALAKLAPTWRPDPGFIASMPATSGAGATFGISGIAEDDPFWLSVPPAVELACYRIAQEALSNAAKHGQAQHVEIELSLEQQELCLTITDDGRGFDPPAVSRNTERAGFGIIGMHERLKLLNGRLEIVSAPGTGTQVVAMIPLESVKSMVHTRAVASKQRREVCYDPYSVG